MAVDNPLMSNTALLSTVFFPITLHPSPLFVILCYLKSLTQIEIYSDIHVKMQYITFLLACDFST